MHFLLIPAATHCAGAPTIGFPGATGWAVQLQSAWNFVLKLWNSALAGSAVRLGPWTGKPWVNEVKLLIFSPLFESSPIESNRIQHVNLYKRTYAWWKQTQMGNPMNPSNMLSEDERRKWKIVKTVWEVKMGGKVWIKTLLMGRMFGRWTGGLKRFFSDENRKRPEAFVPGCHCLGLWATMALGPCLWAPTSATAAPTSHAPCPMAMRTARATCRTACTPWPTEATETVLKPPGAEERCWKKMHHKDLNDHRILSLNTKYHSTSTIITVIDNVSLILMNA